MSDAKHHWLVAGNVVATAGRGQIGQKGFNTLVRTEQPIFTRVDLATAQQGLMQRFVEETDPKQGAKIVDVLILSVNNLGRMTQEEFEKGFPAPTTEEVKH